MNPYRFENGIELETHLLPAQTVPDALIASILGMGLKALSAPILGFILSVLFIVLISLVFGFFSLAGQEENFKNAMTSFASHLPQGGHITQDDLPGVFPIIFVGLFTGLLLPLCCDFILFYLKRKEEREGMKDEFVRCIRRNSLLIGMVFIFALVTIPIARYGEGITAFSISANLAGLCLAALIANLFFVAFDTFANQLIWHAGLVFYKKFF